MAWSTATPATPTSICWFLCSDSANRHILWCGDSGVGPMTPKLAIGRDCCTMHLTAKFHHPTFNRSEVIVLTIRQTNRRRWKHPPRSAMLRRRVKNKLLVLSSSHESNCETVRRRRMRKWLERRQYAGRSQVMGAERLTERPSAASRPSSDDWTRGASTLLNAPSPSLDRQLQSPPETLPTYSAHRHDHQSATNTRQS